MVRQAIHIHNEKAPGLIGIDRMVFHTHWNFSLVFLCSLMLGTGSPDPCPAASNPATIDLEAFRTSVSPGTIDEDLQQMKDLIPELARRMFPPGEGRLAEPETIDFKEVRVPRLAPDEKGGFRTSYHSVNRMVINGRKYLRAAESYLFWRRDYEKKWIASASPTAQAGEIPQTPLQQIFSATTLDRRGKTHALLDLYSRQLLPTPVPAPTPRPDFWPISDIFDIPEASGTVQFNLRGGKVVVLEKGSGEVWILPFDPALDPMKWLESFRFKARRHGIGKAAEMMRSEGIIAPSLEPKPLPLPQRPYIGPRPFAPY
ncbi:MAG: hypothetical protein UZ16_OP3001000381 [Candidatus Hinthialibacteria bacterium OLB16]|nr:MAG: hypothetical protein UZ16_OP3001000381 [Candidatus Hinthialibacteria bacterium OLB16]